jgi:hypothetical protein
VEGLYQFRYYQGRQWGVRSGTWWDGEGEYRREVGVVVPALKCLQPICLISSIYAFSDAIVTVVSKGTRSSSMKV